MSGSAFTAGGLGLLVGVLVAWLASVVPDQHRILATADAGVAPSSKDAAVLR